MEDKNYQIKLLKDYKESDFNILETHLNFTIKEDKINVIANLHLKKNNKNANTLILDGNDLETLSIKINSLDVAYTINKSSLEIPNINDDTFTLTTEVNIDPYNNTSLMGIYKSSSCICSQCEPEGFRKITWYIDRPDVMSVWYVTISAADNKYETLLSNGNLISQKVENNIKTCTFHDICPKPSYLFAFVAGNFDSVNDVFITKSNRKVDLAVYVEKDKKEQAYFALESLKKSMKWDEEVFDLEYELDIFSIVAVSDFNMGAMENKSLNIFNDSLVLATPKIATDYDYFQIEAVVAHEYFHNFTGNRITCKNWFQLTLKEGLTVYRDHRFSEDLHNKDIVRIDQVDMLKNYQFPEDNSKLSHPIRPTSYIEMDNFYTATVYEKGSEVIRMIETIIGKDIFKKGIDIYFDNFDGQAVTCEDFLWSMEKASGISLEKFKQWYLQSGTPIVKIKTIYNENNKSFKIDLEQVNNPTHDQSKKENLVIPLKIALISNGAIHNEKTIIFDKQKDTHIINDLTVKPILSVNRFFSAPVFIDYPQTDDELIQIIFHEKDGYAKYEAMQSFLRKHLITWIDNKENGIDIDIKQLNYVTDIYDNILNNYQNNMHLTSYLLVLPSITSFQMYYKKDFPLESIYYVLHSLTTAISDRYEKVFFKMFLDLHDDENTFSKENMEIRSLKNQCLYMLCKSSNKDDYIKNVVSYYYNTKNMTKRMGALNAIKDLNIPKRTELLDDFYNEYKEFPTVINKYLAIQARISDVNNLLLVKNLMNHEAFSITNPNKVRALIGSFAHNIVAFHKTDGSGYKFLSDMILKLDKINSHMSSSLAKILIKYDTHKKERILLIKENIASILSHKDLSKGLLEILSKSTL